MMRDHVDEFYYLTVYNEKYSHPEINLSQKDDILKGGYLFKDNSIDGINVNLMGSGPIFRECLKASEELKKDPNWLRDKLKNSFNLV